MFGTDVGGQAHHHAEYQIGQEDDGVALSFPIGMLTIALTLHQRYGAEVARATLADTQLGMLSLVAFSAVLAATAAHLSPALSFGLALAASLGTSSALWAWQRRLRRPRPA
ncbi:hypothetical protein KUW00_01445 [Halomonas sp. DP5N14-9]|uniref:hypothetical protein n=1 Tax=Halomonas sp. DP5N14-9 TaxID=2859075 RepID=UPI001C998B8E|nr:hypothetical protein [Halomonas sp. DP5N14-9]MBY5939547.1 hypothetical protein [Halomonas sp. DP5N14-9]